MMTEVSLELFLTVLGGLLVCKFVLSILCGVYSAFLRPGKNVKKLGSWAIVTGATDGIGKAYAFEFAKKGMNVLLISRTERKLEEVKEELLKSSHDVQVSILPIDYAEFDSAARTRVAEAIKNLDVGILVNNVGMSYSFPKYFDELTPSEVEDMMNLNVQSTTWMTYLVLPGMKQRKRGAIINISSAAGLLTSPLLTEYAAAKSYIKSFSESLAVEMKQYNISVQCQAPLFVATKLAKIKKSSLFIPSPSSYARAAVAAIGYETTISPYWSHRLQLFILSLCPKFVVDNYIFSTHASFRKRGLKKESEKQKSS